LLFDIELSASSTSTLPDEPFDDTMGTPLPELPALIIAELPWKELILLTELFEGSSSDESSNFLNFFRLLATCILYDSFSSSL